LTASAANAPSKTRRSKNERIGSEPSAANTPQASGLVGFTLALRNDYHRENFGMTALCPGAVDTNLLA
jgi:NAD(P)-dependent dehydrogenase (short-subunit alcohol dehydrogenase family)